MIKKYDINRISNILNNKIIKYELLSNSFNINCVKILLENKKKLIVKYYSKKENNFNAIVSESKNLDFLRHKNLNYFPKVIFRNNRYLITEFISNNSKIPNITNNDFLNAVLGIHGITDDSYGFPFDTQIGGVKHKNKNSKNWFNFFCNTRFIYMYKLANKLNPIDSETNKRIELLINKMNNIIPNNPKPILLHGDLWEGNILFENNKFRGFIDPGSFFGHNEMELAYLRWFNPVFIDKKFLEKYDQYINLSNNYFEYEPVYQLYYALSNVALWNKSYIKEVKKILNKLGF